jgi:phospholipid/cholesterol/gamma-HCH transport system substrate-binding protein
VLYARGVFEDTQRIALITDNAEGIAVGTDLTFAGFPIGRVRSIRLRDDGKVRIGVRVPVSEGKWLRESSIFVIEVPLVGAGQAARLHGEPAGSAAARTAPSGRCCAAIRRRKSRAWSPRCARCSRTSTR